jgi:hypothetical protein
MEKDIIFNAIRNFNLNSNLNLVLNEVVDYSNDNDGILRLSSNLKEFKLRFEVKSRLTFSKLLGIDDYLKNQTILISDYIPKKLKAHLKAKNISYLDAAGNAFITNNDGLFLFLETNKSSKLTSGQSNRAFSKSGLKVLYQLLNNEEIVNLPYRNIAHVSMVSIDTVGKVFKELLRDKYLVRINNNQYKINNKNRLFEEWVTVFNKILRPKLKQQRFRTRDFNIKELTNIAFPDSIGGELGGEVLSNYLIAESVIIYTEKSFVETAKKLNLIPDRNGTITIVEKFWNNDIINVQKTEVSPVLIYADLLNKPVPRNLETAKIISNKYVKNTL